MPSLNARAEILSEILLLKYVWKKLSTLTLIELASDWEKIIWNFHWTIFTANLMGIAWKGCEIIKHLISDLSPFKFDDDDLNSFEESLFVRDTETDRQTVHTHTHTHTWHTHTWHTHTNMHACTHTHTHDTRTHASTHTHRGSSIVIFSKLLN